MKVKTAKILSVLVSVLALFASCGQLAENGGESQVTISLPYVAGANSRAIDPGKKDDLINATASYRVHMNDRVLEGTGGNFSASFAVGIRLDIYVECVNGNGEVILRTVTKSIVVGSGRNSVSFNLMAEGNEVMPQGQWVEGRRTVLYPDGTLIINELPDARRSDSPTAVYDAMLPDGSNYVFSTESTRPWNGDKDSIRSVVIGSDISPTNMDYWFCDLSNCTSITLTKLNTSNVTTMYQMFNGCSSLTSLDLSSFNTSNVTNMAHMFKGCSSLTRITFGTNFDTSRVTTMSYMFKGCSSLTSLDVSNFNTSSVTYMYDMFYNCSSLTSLDLSNFNTSSVTDMDGMFNGCRQLATIYASNDFDTANARDGSMFYGCSALRGGNGTAFSSSNTDKTYARIDNPPDAPGYFTEK